MTLVGGGELFTGNTAVVTAAVMEGRATQAELRKSWYAKPRLLPLNRSLPINIST